MRFFAASDPAIASTGTISQKRPNHIAIAEQRVVERRVRGEAGERAAVVVAGRGERVQDLGEAMRAGVGDAALPASTHTATAVPTSTRSGGTRIASDAIFISKASIFLPRYSGVRPIISPAMNTARIANISMPYSPEPTPPKMTSPSCISTSARGRRAA